MVIVPNKSSGAIFFHKNFVMVEFLYQSIIMYVISINGLIQAFSGKVTFFKTVLLFRRAVCFMEYLSVSVLKECSLINYSYS